MPDKPAAELLIDERLVRALVDAQYPAGEGLPLAHAADGWDCSVWRLGDDRAVRVPRREAAAPLVLHEQRWLPGIAARLALTGVALPMPVHAGSPAAGYPWPWSIVPWIDGSTGLDVPIADRRGWAIPLAEALAALHIEAPADHPRNPFRGAPLEQRSGAVTQRLVALDGSLDSRDRLALTAAWDDGIGAEPWPGPAVWIHGDLHPGNLVADGARLTGIIDFGDITAGDPAYDLAVAWLAFDPAGREAFRDACPWVDASTWVRARAWAASVCLMLLAHSDDNPPYAALGREALEALAGG